MDTASEGARPAHEGATCGSLWAHFPLRPDLGDVVDCDLKLPPWRAGCRHHCSLHTSRLGLISRVSLGVGPTLHPSFGGGVKLQPQLSGDVDQIQIRWAWGAAQVDSIHYSRLVNKERRGETLCYKLVCRIPSTAWVKLDHVWFLRPSLLCAAFPALICIFPRRHTSITSWIRIWKISQCFAFRISFSTWKLKHQDLLLLVITTVFSKVNQSIYKPYMRKMHIGS